jgi:hypothetical protein
VRHDVARRRGEARATLDAEVGGPAGGLPDERGNAAGEHGEDGTDHGASRLVSTRSDRENGWTTTLGSIGDPCQDA